MQTLVFRRTAVNTKLRKQSENIMDDRRVDDYSEDSDIWFKWDQDQLVLAPNFMQQLFRNYFIRDFLWGKVRS